MTTAAIFVSSVQKELAEARRAVPCRPGTRRGQGEMNGDMNRRKLLSWKGKRRYELDMKMPLSPKGEAWPLAMLVLQVGDSPLRTCGAGGAARCFLAHSLDRAWGSSEPFEPFARPCIPVGLDERAARSGPVTLLRR